MKITVVTGSRADWGLLEMPIKALEADPYFQGQVLRLWGDGYGEAYLHALDSVLRERPDVLMLLGDRFEILAAATAAHLERVPIAHIGGGDVSLGSYDDAMRDCISRMASIHFPTSRQSEQRLASMGYSNIHWIGNVALDFIMHGDWKRERPIDDRYVVVSYQPETIDDTVDWASVQEAVGDTWAVYLMPNLDRGSERIRSHIIDLGQRPQGVEFREEMPRAEFLNLLYHAYEFIGNSSAMFYEAPALGVKTRVIGKRQQGRVIPTGDGKASERIVKALKEWR